MRRGYIFKRIVSIVLVALLLLSFAGCGIKEKIEQQVGEAIVEGAINGAASGGEKVDINGSQITITGEDGTTAVIGGEGTAWPTDKAAALLPKFSKGKVSSAMNSDTYCLVIVAEVTEGDYDSYRKDVEAAGYTKSTFESADETSKMYSGSKDDKNNVTISYSFSEKSITMMAAISE